METPAKIFTSICEINKEIQAIGKNRKNEQQNFKFRGIDDVMNELHDLFAKHEVFISPIVQESSVSERTNKNNTLLFHTRLKVKFEFYASDGSKLESFAIGEAMDSGDKGINKAMSVALKYVLLQMFLIPTEESKDPDQVSHEVVKSEKGLKEKALEAAIYLIKSQSKLDDVQKIWSDHKHFQKEQSFIEAKEMMKVALTNKE